MAAATTALLGWRVWRFALHPILHSDEPREVPYWLPYVGHARNFAKNQDSILSYGREYFQNSREPFTISFGPEKLYILTSYHDVVTAYKIDTTLDYRHVIRDLVGSFGVSRAGVDKVYSSNPDFFDEIRRQNPHSKSLFQLKSEFYHVQLHPGQHFQIIQDKFLTLINQAMEFSNPPESAMRFISNGTGQHASLYRWCQLVFVKAGIIAFFGERML